ncbi:MULTISPECIES: efflux RND transporter periplasmic adaptor subunit [Dyadobacter]|uniref:Efflux RND transporter periplasmic adaptor subunit n=1 Tax=Dyadobacter psychrotolerans TaxID=2541721 RepID=A0A4R5DFJ4_9BACT|nr:efflux RND transporter periplasmic adaptor subunit [Dyadobacter psychrotolerans]TDE09415.1 efflux RND transporter periplasmic adaptor subunit [Dyadobacter psychrotolerans]
MKNIIVVLFLLAVLSSCSKSEGEKPETTQQAPKEDEKEAEASTVELTKAQYETAGIEIGTTTTRNISEVVTANGKIDIPPQNLVSISAPMGGFVRKTELLQGMKVKKGQILATIENPDFIQIQQDYLETQSKLEYAQLEFKRQTELSKENINAQKVLQQASSEVKTQKARLEGLTERLKTAGINLKTLDNGTIVNSASIYSPISGSVTTVNVNIGKYVNPTDVMFEIVDTDHLHVELSVFEQDIPKIRLGQLVHFTVSNNADKEYTAKVYLINQKINEDRTVRVHCHLSKDEPGLLPENFVKAIVEIGANPVSALPEQAIVDFEGKSYIFIQNAAVKDSTGAGLAFEMTEVNRGASENGFSQVKFQEGFDGKSAKIVLKGAYALLAKLKNAEEEE